ncbi:hypothetical protein HWV62_45448 [Athelia sp. TMB]|nr:hypothetical protein HWV62_45448 [Athelia sp. TMB]
MYHLEAALERLTIHSSSSFRSLSIHNAQPTGAPFHLPTHIGAFSQLLQTLQLYEISDLQLPEMTCLRVLVLSGSRKRIPLQSIASVLGKLPLLQTLVFEGSPIAFKPYDSTEYLSTALPATALSSLTCLRLRGLRSRRELIHNYLARLLALLSPASSIMSLEVETGIELQDLADALHNPWPSTRFPNLRIATFQIISPPDRSLQNLLNIFTTISDAKLWLMPSHKEYRLMFKPSLDSATRLSPLVNLPRLERVEFRFATESRLRKFLDIAAKDDGLRTLWASPATVHELLASGIWTAGHVTTHCANQAGECSHIHLVCEGNETLNMCLKSER